MIKFLNCLALSSAVNSIKNENSIQILSKYYYNTLEVKWMELYNTIINIMFVYNIYYNWLLEELVKL